MTRHQPRARRQLNVLLTNGRFPATLDLARQLRLAGHRICVVDAMHYHVCKFSKVVARSYQVPAPKEDSEGYIRGVMDAVRKENIDLIIPMHEEIFYLAEAAQSNGELRSKLLSPPFKQLIALHNKWEFSRFMTKCGMRVPATVLCKSYEDVEGLDRSREWALKPVYGRAATNVYHLKPDKPLPKRGDIDVSDEAHYVAQEWLKGNRYCTYSVLQDGKVTVWAAYPVVDTIDGSSCVYFEALDKPEIKQYMEQMAACLPGVSGQFALDLIEPEDGTLLAIECNPRATSGIHLFSGRTELALALTCRCPVDSPVATEVVDHKDPPKGAKRKVAPGMLMWKPAGSKESGKAIAKEYAGHMKRLVASRDVMWSWKDLTPSLMQPFLLTSYYEICREKKLKLPTMFQSDYVWEPKGEHLSRVRAMFEGKSIPEQVEPFSDAASVDRGHSTPLTMEKNTVNLHPSL